MLKKFHTSAWTQNRTC